MAAIEHLPAVSTSSSSRCSGKSSTTASSYIETEMKNDSRRPSSSPSSPSSRRSPLPHRSKGGSPKPESARTALSSSVQDMIARLAAPEHSSSAADAKKPSLVGSQLQAVAWDGSLLNNDGYSPGTARNSEVVGHDTSTSDFQNGKDEEKELDEKMARYAQRKARKKIEREERFTTGVRDYGSKVRREMEVQAGRLCPEGFRSTCSSKPVDSMGRSYTTAPAKLNWKEASPSSGSTSPFGFSKSRTPSRPMCGSPTTSWPGRRVPFFQSQDLPPLPKELAQDVKSYRRIGEASTCPELALVFEDDGEADNDGEEDDVIDSKELSLEEKMAIYWASKKRKPEKPFKDGFRSDDSADHISRCSSYMTARSRASCLGAGWTELPAAEVSHRAKASSQWESPESHLSASRSWVATAEDIP
mmetsp:Transcript_6530/g.10484  ORF Transcript_6530/g.10484 Transcript_6530/m.10484 type:complete len:416 (-) Transcript_6530:138-1385(-)